MARRAFSLTELLVVVAILGGRGAMNKPVFARSKDRAKLTDCGTRLHGFAAALNLYRADHDDRGFVWVSRDNGHNHYRYPYNTFEPMSAYLEDGRVLWCREPNPDPITAWDFVHYQAFPSKRDELPGIGLHVPARPVPGTVVAYCSNHGTGPGPIRQGTYPFVHEDMSMALARSEAVRVGFDDRHDTRSEHPYGMLRFPGEPWPPAPEE